MNRRRVSSMLFLCAAIGFALQCSNGVGDIAGGTTDSGNGRIFGMLHDSRGAPVANAHVSLYEFNEGFWASSPVDTDRTNDRGEYAFLDVAEGGYQITAVTEDYELVAPVQHVTLGEAQDTALVPGTMTKSNAVEAYLPYSEAVRVPLRAYLRNSPYSVPIDNTGSFSFPALADGLWELVVVPDTTLAEMPVIAVDTVSVAAGSVIGSHALPAFTVSTQSPDTVLLKDFDAKSGFTTLGGAWWSFTDVDFPGVTQPSTMTRVDSFPAMDSTGFAARYTIRFSDESSSAAGFGCDIGPLYSGMHRAYDLSQLSGIQFDCMGDSVSVSVQLYSPLAGYSTIRKFKPQQNWARHSISMAEALAGLSAAEKDQWEQVKRFVTRFQFTIVRNEAPKQSSISVDTIVFVF